MKTIFFNLFVLFAAISAVQCSTGIENTKPITMSRNDRKNLEPSPEEKIMESLKALPLQQWEKGKKFLVSDNRASLVFDPIYNHQDTALGGKTIFFDGIGSKMTPGGSEEAVIRFTDGKDTYTYSTGKKLNSIVSSFTSMDVPMLIDLNLVDQAADMLQGMKVWTRNQLWYDPNGETMRGRKFVPVTIEKVSPGTMVFPLRLDIIDENGKPAMLYMNIGTSGIESRTFKNLFYLSDPKLRYPDILPSTWEAIQNGRLVKGMTKEECKLSVGNPADVNSGHDWNSTLDIWQYPNGTYLQFQDGVLVGFRN